MQKILFVLVCLLAACTVKKTDTNLPLNEIATRYVKLGLAIGMYDGDFVDAYYGPDSLKPTGAKQAVFPKDSFLARVDTLTLALKAYTSAEVPDSLRTRARWMTFQLRAFGRRIRIFSGEYHPFDEESKDLFSVAAPVYTPSYYDSLLRQLDSLLTGKGSIAERYQQLASKYIIPVNRIDTVFKTAIAEARKRTTAHYQLPANENFSLEYVTGKPWSGYNWYQGNYKSLIQVNTGIPVFIERAIDLACHEGYPGHHVYNMLLEKNLYRDKGYVEISLYPLFSPQSLIAEGSANFGIQVAFPGNEQEQYIKQVLAPLAGLDGTAIDKYFTALAIRAKLAYARNEAARGLINGTMNEKEVLRWLTDYLLLEDKAAVTYLNFIKKYRSYVINYNYGQDLVKQEVESKGGTTNDQAKRWQLFEELLSTQVIPADLQK